MRKQPIRWFNLAQERGCDTPVLISRIGVPYRVVLILRFVGSPETDALFIRALSPRHKFRCS